MGVRFKDHTDDVMKRVTEQIGLALDLAGEVIEGHAKDECPVDTGRLRNSITHVVGERDRACYVGTNVEYGPAVEFRDNVRHNVGKAHFLRDGAVDHIDEIRDVMQKTLNSI